MNHRHNRLILSVLIALEAALLLLGPQPREHLPVVEAALAAGQKPDWWDDAALGMHYAAWINIGLLSLLLLTSKWWTRPFTPPEVSTLKSAGSNPKWFWPLAIVAVITCLALRLPLASKSLWWDEAWVIQQASHGKWRPDSKQPEKLKFMAHDWKRCAFYYQKPTNHAPMSLAQKASISTWQKLTGANRAEFSDLAARVPALLASCAAVLVTALLLRSWGQPGVGIAAALVLALHPWHMRYGVDARAYALVVPLCLGGLFAISRILQSDGAKILPWVCWGLIEFIWLWAYPNAVVDVAALNLIALGFLVWRHAVMRERWTVFCRLAATNVFAAACLIQMFLPNLMQARRWAGQEADAHLLDATILQSTLSQLFLGVEFAWPLWPESAGLPFLAALSQPFQMLCWALMVLMAVLGMAGLWRTSREGAMVTGSIIVSCVAFALVTRFAGSYFYPRFVMAALPCFIILACFAFALAVRHSVQARWGTIGLALLLSYAYGPVSAAQMGILLTRPIAPLHDVAGFVREQSAKDNKPPLILCYGLGREVLSVYEPRCVGVEDAAGLRKAIEQARVEQRALFVIQGYNNFNRQLLPEGIALLDDSSLFTEAAAFPGIDPEFYFRVFRMTGW